MKKIIASIALSCFALSSIGFAFAYAIDKEFADEASKHVQICKQEKILVNYYQDNMEMHQKMVEVQICNAK